MDDRTRLYQFVRGQWQPVAGAPPGEPAEIRVLTWNVWFGDHLAEERRAALLRELDRRRPDVIALQEVTPALLEELTAEAWVRSRYQLSDVELWQRYDVVMLARVPVRGVTSLELPSAMGRRVLGFELACGLVVATVHLESMKEHAEARATQLQRIQPFLADLGSDSALVGDMNFRPDDALETAAIEPRFVDAWPVLHPTAPGFTADSVTNSMRYMLKPTLSQKRIDRVFVSGRWRASAIELVGAQPIDDEGTFVSDHFGLEAVLTPT